MNIVELATYVVSALAVLISLNSLRIVAKVNRKRKR